MDLLRPKPVTGSKSLSTLLTLPYFEMSLQKYSPYGGPYDPNGGPYDSGFVPW